MSRYLLALGLVACGSRVPVTPVGNLGDNTTEPPVRVDPAGPMGVIALGTAAARADDQDYWIPVTTVAPVVAAADSGLVAGTAYDVVPGGGDERVKLTAGATVTVPYGCDGNAQEMMPLAGPGVRPGLVWVLPAEVPVSWMPSSRRMEIVEHEPARARWRVDELVIELARKDDAHASFTITNGATPVHREDAETYYMEGAEVRPLDLSAGRAPGIPVPLAVFAFGAGGPYLVVVDRSGYEGVAFETLFIDHTAGDRARAVESLGLGLYYCAF